eukprot:4936093-Pleurochrysis_carterae.AAC.1
MSRAARGAAKCSDAMGRRKCWVTRGLVSDEHRPPGMTMASPVFGLRPVLAFLSYSEGAEHAQKGVSRGGEGQRREGAGSDRRVVALADERILTKDRAHGAV